MEKSSIVRDTTGENFVERKVASSNLKGLLDDFSNQQNLIKFRHCETVRDKAAEIFVERYRASHHNNTLGHPRAWVSQLKKNQKVEGNQLGEKSYGRRPPYFPNKIIQDILERETKIPNYLSHLGTYRQTAGECPSFVSSRMTNVQLRAFIVSLVAHTL